MDLESCVAYEILQAELTNEQSDMINNKLIFNIYKLEVGVIAENETGYNNVYDKKHQYFDEEVSFFLDYKQAKEYAKNYVKNGVKNTYAIINEIRFDNEEFGLNTLETLCLIYGILESLSIDNYDIIFKDYDIYGVGNIVYSAKKETKVIENFIKEGNLDK